MKFEQNKQRTLEINAKRRRGSYASIDQLKKDQWANQVLFNIDVFNEGGSAIDVVRMFKQQNFTDAVILRDDLYSGKISSREHNRGVTDLLIVSFNKIIALGIPITVPTQLIQRSIDQYRSDFDLIQTAPSTLNKETEKLLCAAGDIMAEYIYAEIARLMDATR